MTEQDLLSRAPEVLTRRMSRTTMFRIAFGCIVAAEVLMLLWVGRKEWYFFDEWRLIMERVLPHPGGLLGNFRLMFRPDSEHVIGIPLTLYVFLFRTFGLGSYWPMIFVNIIVRVATLFVVDLICRRAGARRVVRLLAVACIAFFGEGYESLFAQSVMFAGFTLVFALLAISESLKEDVSENRAGLISAAWLSASILSSSYGFPVVVGVALFYLLTHRRRAAVISFVVPPIVFLVIRGIAGGTYASQQPLSSNRLPLYIHYVQSGLSAVGESILGMDGLGLVSFVIISVAALWLASTDRTRAFVISMIVAIVAFYFEASLSRSVFGAEQAGSATRYTFFCGVLAVCMLAAAWGAKRAEGKWVPVLGVLLIVSFANNIAWLGDGSDFYTSRMQISKDRIALGLAVIDRNLTFYSPDPEWAGSLVGDDLGELMATSYKDTFMGEAGRCFDHWNQELARAGIADDAIDDEQRAALLVLMSENALGLGDVGKTLGELIQFAGSPATDNGLLTQFTDSYTTLAAGPLGTSGFVPTKVRCSQL
jgi:hypothetical protein